MKTLTFIWSLFKSFPAGISANIFLIVFVGLAQTFSVLSLAPVIDFLLQPNLNNISSITKAFINFLELIRIPATKVNFILIFLLVIVVQNLLIILAKYSILRTKYAILKLLIKDTFNSFFKARWSFFASSEEGKILNTFNREMLNIGDSLSAIGTLFSDLFRLFFYVAISFFISWQVTATAMALGIIFAIPLLFLGNINYHLGLIRIATDNKFMSVIKESISAAKLILGFSNQDKHMQEVNSVFDLHAKVATKFMTLNAATPKIYEPFGWAAILLTMYFSFEHFGVPIVKLGMVAYALLRIIPLIGELTAQKNAIQNFFPSFEQLQAINESARQQAQKSGSLSFERLNDSIELKNVSFSYPGHKPILNSINASIKKGQMVGFAGVSGAGKTTLIDLILGFYEPSNGKIFLDRVELSEYDIYSFRKKIGYVPQESFLFNTTIKENLIWARENSTTEEIIEACKLANAHDFITKMPKGYNTVVGDRGIRLSGGERQRIALARAILRKPELLILDEATSAIDSQSEALIQQAIEKIADNTTIIMIAHRLSTIIRADWIYVLKDGTIIEEGKYNELIELMGTFSQMAKLQNLGAR